MTSEQKQHELERLLGIFGENYMTGLSEPNGLARDAFRKITAMFDEMEREQQVLGPSEWQMWKAAEQRVAELERQIEHWMGTWNNCNKRVIELLEEKGRMVVDSDGKSDS